MADTTAEKVAYKFLPIDMHASSKNRKRPVIMISQEGKRSCFPSVREAARVMDVHSSNIVGCLKGRLKTAGGYCWQYAEGGTLYDR